MSLTAPGWPRPVVDGWPVPWVSPPDHLAQMDGARKTALLDTRMCQVCGVCYSPGDSAYVCVSTPVDDEGHPVERPEDATAVALMDEALMHERCMKLATGRCPRLLRLRRESCLLVLRVPVDDVEIRGEEQVALLSRAEVVVL